MSQLPTWWYRTEYFWIGLGLPCPFGNRLTTLCCVGQPHWQMNAELKRYYIMQLSYWCQQLIVLLLGLEKPRKDYSELVFHHFVTLWLIGLGSSVLPTINLLKMLFLQLELFAESHPNRQCGIREHGHSGCFFSGIFILSSHLCTLSLSCDSSPSY